MAVSYYNSQFSVRDVMDRDAACLQKYSILSINYILFHKGMQCMSICT